MNNRTLSYCLHFVIALTAVVACTLAGCNNNSCTDNRSSLLLCGFYNNEAKPASITLDSIEMGGVGAPYDSLLLGVADHTSKLYLPLRSRDTSTSFFIHYCQKELDYSWLNDTITLRYTSEPYFVSQECGAIYRSHVKEMTYTRHLVDSVALLDSLINNLDVEKMKIMFRTASDAEVQTTSLP